MRWSTVSSHSLVDTRTNKIRRHTFIQTHTETTTTSTHSVLLFLSCFDRFNSATSQSVMSRHDVLTELWPGSHWFRHHSMSSLNNNRINFLPPSSGCYRSKYCSRQKYSLSIILGVCDITILLLFLTASHLWVPNCLVRPSNNFFYDFVPSFQHCSYCRDTPLLKVHPKYFHSVTIIVSLHSNSVDMWR